MVNVDYGPRYPSGQSLGVSEFQFHCEAMEKKKKIYGESLGNLLPMLIYPQNRFPRSNDANSSAQCSIRI
jgi:hypothetical protein